MSDQNCILSHDKYDGLHYKQLYFCYFVIVVIFIGRKSTKTGWLWFWFVIYTVVLGA